MRFTVGLHLPLYYLLIHPSQPGPGWREVLLGTLGDTDLLGGTSGDEDGSVQTLSQVVQQQEGTILLIPSPTHLTLGNNQEVRSFPM